MDDGIPANLIYDPEPDDDSGTDTESLASLRTDDGQNHPPERILAERPHSSPDLDSWILIKWMNTSILRSSWQVGGIFLQAVYPQLVEAWEIEKKRQEEGLSKPFDLAALREAQAAAETRARQRRKLRRLKRRVQRVLDILTA